MSARLAGVRAAYGALQLLRPAYSAEQLFGGPLDPPGLAVVRVLGTRQLAQAGLSAAAPTAPLLKLGAATDAVHALTMVALALASPKWRRPALVSGLTATVFAVGGALAAGRAASRAGNPLPGLYGEHFLGGGMGHPDFDHGAAVRGHQLVRHGCAVQGDRPMRRPVLTFPPV